MQGHYLVTGASGFVGQPLIKALAHKGYQVATVGRKFFDSNTDMFYEVPDFSNKDAFSSALKNCDVVIHLAARVHVMQDCAVNPLQAFLDVNLSNTLNLARQAAAAGVRRFVYVSSVKVNGEFTEGDSFAEADEPAPQDPYAVSKWQAEQALMTLSKQVGIEVVVIRPPLVYGKGVKANFLSLLIVINKKIPLPLRCISNKRSMIYVENLVDALITCATHPNAAGKTYLVSDGQDVSTPDLVRKIAKSLNKKPLLLPIPVVLMHFLASLFGKSAAVDRLTQSLVIDSSKIRNELGWQPPYTMEAGLKATADWYLESTASGKK